MAESNEAQSEGQGAAPEGGGKPTGFESPEYQAKLAEILGAPAAPDGDGGGGNTFAESLESEGVDVTVTPKAEGSVETPPEPEADATAEPDGEGADALVAALTGDTRAANREDKIARTEALEEAAKAKGIPEGVARALARNVAREEAEKFLDGYGAEVQSAPADQPVAPTSPVPEGAQQGRASVEVQRLLEEELGEDTASAVAGVIAGLEAQVAEAKELAGMSAGAMRQAQDAKSRQSVMSAAGELSGQFPGLVRDGIVDLAVGKAAAALIESGVFPREDLKGALEFAARGHFGAAQGAEPARQTKRLTRSPDLEAPVSRTPGNARPLSKREAAQDFGSIMEKHRGDPDKMQAALIQRAEQIRQNNERLR